MNNNEQQSNAFNETAFGSEDRTDAPAPPERPNEGGTSGQAETSVTLPAADTPRLVTRGESSYHEIIGEDGESYVLVSKNGYPKLIHIPKPKADGNPSAAIVDYLNCTFSFSHSDLHKFFAELLPVLGNAFAPAINRGIGKYG